MGLLFEYVVKGFENCTLMDLVYSQQSLIQPDQMRIVLESEAASVYCQYMHFADEKVKEPVKMEKTGFKFMVFDHGRQVLLYIFF